MRSLDTPVWKRYLGKLVAGIVFLMMGMLSALPDALLARMFGILYRLVTRLGGEGPASRALADLAYVFGRGGEGAMTFRKVLAGARWEEIEGVVAGAVVRSLP